MTLSLEQLNALPAARAVAHFLTCCGSTRWAAAMAARRPYGSVGALVTAADELWRGTRPSDWRQAFDAHPRIGEPRPRTGSPDAAGEWSAQEQREAARGEPEVLDALARGNAEYERRFGQIYLVCANGRSARELLEDLRARLGNPPERELEIAAEEQRKITRLRLKRLLGVEDA